MLAREEPALRHVLVEELSLLDKFGNGPRGPAGFCLLRDEEASRPSIRLGHGAVDPAADVLRILRQAAETRTGRTEEELQGESWERDLPPALLSI